MPISFDAYVAAIDALAAADGAIPAGASYCDPEAWRDPYADELSPDEAWDEECWAAGDCLC